MLCLASKAGPLCHLQGLPLERQQQLMMLLSVGEMAPIFAAMPQTQCCDLLPLLGGALAKEVLVAMPQAPAEKVLRNLEQEVVVQIMEVSHPWGLVGGQLECVVVVLCETSAGALGRRGDWLSPAALRPVQHCS